jgi:hypothetical protein
MPGLAFRQQAGQRRAAKPGAFSCGRRPAGRVLPPGARLQGIAARPVKNDSSGREWTSKRAHPWATARPLATTLNAALAYAKRNDYERITCAPDLHERDPMAELVSLREGPAWCTSLSRDERANP